MRSDPNLEKAARDIGMKPILDLGGREIHVVCVLTWAPPLIAKWWRGKEATIIGVDVDGNFFLRHCDGSVRYWEHLKQSETFLAKSVKEFTAALRNDDNDTLSWWKPKNEPGTS